MEVFAKWLNNFSVKKFIRFSIFFFLVLVFIAILFSLGYFSMLLLFQQETIAAGFGILFMMLGAPLLFLPFRGGHIPFWSPIFLYFEPLLGDKKLQATKNHLIIDEELSFAYADIIAVHHYFAVQINTDTETNEEYSTYFESLELLLECDSSKFSYYLKYIPKYHTKNHVVTDQKTIIKLRLQALINAQKVNKNNFYKLPSSKEYPVLELLGANKQKFIPHLQEILAKKCRVPQKEDHCLSKEKSLN